MLEYMGEKQVNFTEVHIIRVPASSRCLSQNRKQANARIILHTTFPSGGDVARLTREIRLRIIYLSFLSKVTSGKPFFTI